MRYIYCATIFLLTLIVCDVAYASRIGGFVDPLSSLKSGPEACDLILFSSPSFEVPPIVEKNIEESNTYFVFACPKRLPKQYVLWRTRVYNEKVQLVGELSFEWPVRPNDFKYASNANKDADISMSSCLMKNGSNDKRINAIFRGYYDLGSLIPLKHIVIAWEVQSSTMQLIQVSKAKLHDCKVG